MENLISVLPIKKTVNIWKSSENTEKHRFEGSNKKNPVLKTEKNKKSEIYSFKQIRTKGYLDHILDNMDSDSKKTQPEKLTNNKTKTDLDKILDKMNSQKQVKKKAPMKTKTDLDNILDNMDRSNTNL